MYGKKNVKIIRPEVAQFPADRRMDENKRDEINSCALQLLRERVKKNRRRSFCELDAN
jgi:hypothetical protein